MPRLDLPDPVEAIKFRMEQAGLTAKDLEPMIGRRNRVYEILNRKRGLTLQMIATRSHRSRRIRTLREAPRFPCVG